MATNGAAPHQTRRTFAIISHPDAGKTTLTEKLLLSGGAIRAAGQVRARGERRRARSDWMKIEQERGISVSSSVMTFERKGIIHDLQITDNYVIIFYAPAFHSLEKAMKGEDPLKCMGASLQFLLVIK